MYFSTKTKFFFCKSFDALRQKFSCLFRVVWYTGMVFFVWYIMVLSGIVWFCLVYYGFVWYSMVLSGIDIVLYVAV